jgi:GDP-L-fucose synthase
MKVLVTGGAGFVGRYLVHALLEKKWDVTVVDALVIGSGGISPFIGWPIYNPFDYENFTFINKDCRSFFKSETQMEFDMIFHLAAMVGGRLTIENDPLLVANDLSIDSDMWRWAAERKIARVINFSSSAAYPVKLQQSAEEIVVLSEDMINFDENLGMPDLTYGWAKLTSEYLGRIAWARYGIKNIVYRPFSGYGPDQDFSYPFPSICKRAIDGLNNNEFTVWGNGTQRRDFIHVKDCVDGVLMTYDKIEDGNALNLSTGIATSFIEFADLATGLLGYTPKIVVDESKPMGVISRVGDTNKQAMYNFKPNITFREGVKDALNYLMKSTRIA